MLGRLRMPIAVAIEKYAKLVKEVFKDKKLSGHTMYKRTKLQEALKAMVREATGDEREMMRDYRETGGCQTAVFAMARHNMNAGMPVLFRSYTVSTNPGPDCTISEALQATMAYPDLFESIDIVDSSVPQSFVGGELGCSNPLAHVLSEVSRVFPDRQVACIVSIGAGHTRTIQVPILSRWQRTQDVIVMKDMATDSERVAEEMALRFEGVRGVYFRFNVDQGMQGMKDGSWERMKDVVGAITDKRGVISTAHAAGQILHRLDATTRITKLKRCPAPTECYTGRQNENAQVIACITQGKDERRVCVVYGLGGVGKTQLVLNAIEHTRDEWDHIIYVDASSTEAIEKTFKDFGIVKNIGQDYEDVIRWLESCSETWLVVFDNADSASTNIRQYIPARGRRGSVVITTRLPALARLAVGPNAVCHLSGMDQADGTALLMKIVNSGNQCFPGNDMNTAEALVQDFGGLALAIVHAGAYIAHSPSITIAKYRYLFLSQRQRMLDEYNNLPAMAKLDERGETVYTTWKMCYDQLEPESHQLLWLIAYLHYDGISEDIFKRAAKSTNPESYPLPLTDLTTKALRQVRQFLSTFVDADDNWDTVKFTRVASDLASYSLIEFDRMNLTYRVHVLVHDWAKSVVGHSPELAAECVATLLSLSIGWEQDAESLAFKLHLWPHVTSALIRSQNTITTHSYPFQEVCRCAGQWRQQMELLPPLVADFKQRLGPDHHYTLNSMDNLASTYSDLGRYNEAEQMGLQVVNARKRLLGEDHPSTLTSMNKLASTYLNLRRYNEAEQMGIQVLNARKRVLGEDHPDTLSSINSLASTYYRLGRYNEAEKTGVLVVSAHKRVLGEDHPDTLNSINNLASTYYHLGRYNEAEQMGVQIVNARKRTLGEDHPHTLISMNNLAQTHSAMGSRDKAMELNQKVLIVAQRTLGDQHPYTQVLRKNLTNLERAADEDGERALLSYYNIPIKPLDRKTGTLYITIVPNML
ncbi:unnamed protein product [Rhizoctonia solani]|uniref:NB-ARC domain-containing protein n=1 Tax=Rhizoctonia solani TaxID=456999 RepID=A0A8H3GP88_9AGAM|nr:unnamed protein product [Rhizoctonia solani]